MSNVRQQQKLTNTVTVTFNCPECKEDFQRTNSIKHFERQKRYGYIPYCTRLCSNRNKDKSYSKTSKFKTKCRYYANERLKKGILPKICNTNIKYFSSKGERDLRKTLQEKYPELEFTSGGGLWYRETQLSRDIYSNKVKICIEYDGIWHFKDIKGQLDKKQFKDLLLKEWCTENGYRLLRIKDEIYLKNKEKVLDIISLFLHTTENYQELYA